MTETSYIEKYKEYLLKEINKYMLKPEWFDKLNDKEKEELHNKKCLALLPVRMELERINEILAQHERIKNENTSQK